MKNVSLHLSKPSVSFGNGLIWSYWCSWQKKRASNLDLLFIVTVTVLARNQEGEERDTDCIFRHTQYNSNDKTWRAQIYGNQKYWRCCACQVEKDSPPGPYLFWMKGPGLMEGTFPGLVISQGTKRAQIKLNCAHQTAFPRRTTRGQ